MDENTSTTPPEAPQATISGETNKPSYEELARSNAALAQSLRAVRGVCLKLAAQIDGLVG